MKRATLKIFVFLAVTLFSSVANAASSFPAPITNYVWASGSSASDADGKPCTQNPNNFGSNSAYSNPNGYGCMLNGVKRPFVRQNSSGSTKYYSTGLTAPNGCPANTSANYSTIQCDVDEGYAAVPDGSGGWSVVSSNEGCDGNQFKFYHAETNTCTYFPCDGSTPYMFADGDGGYTCSPPPDSAGCYEGDNQWIATGGASGSTLPENITANGCEYARMTCAEVAALEGFSVSECTSEAIANLAKTGCITIGGSTSCGGWYSGTGQGAYNGGAGAGGGGGVGGADGQPWQGSDGGGGDGGGDGGGGGDDGDNSCGGFGQPSCDEGDEDGDDAGSGGSNGSGDGRYFPDLDSELQESKTNLQNLIDGIKSEAQGMFSIGESGAGSLPCDSVSLGAFGQFELCLSDYSEQLSNVGNILFAAFTLLALFIIFS
jgi:hypothetical protein